MEIGGAQIQPKLKANVFFRYASDRILHCFASTLKPPMLSLIFLAILFLPFAFVGGLAFLWKSKRRRILRWTLLSYLGAIPFFFFVVGPYAMARILTHAGSRPLDLKLKETPADFGVNFESITFESKDGLHLNGWWIPPTTKDGVLICTHGLFRTRVEMLARAMVAAKSGYGVLLYDSRSHGKSEKGVVSLGCHEANDVLGAIQYVLTLYQARPAPKIVLMGISMGAVTTLLAAAQSDRYVAIVVDSPFSDIEETVIDHSWLFFKLPRYPFTPLFLFWFSRFSGCDPRMVNSHLALRHLLPVPMLFIGSEGDRRIGPDVARHLYQESDSPLKRIKIFGDDVGHGAAYRLHPDIYAGVLVDFLDQALANGSSGTASGAH